jgi:hydroxyacylglutathione hydrolase
MIFRRYKDEGLAHYSYLIADEGQAAVIDPRRDIDVYLTDAARDQAYIVSVFETHRNEDYLIGSCEIETATGARIFHADSQWDYQYGEPVEDGQTWRIGRLKIKAIHTPGHTPGSMSYLLHDPDGNPWVLFSGDALFSGDGGRVDLLGEDRLPEMAGMLYDSIFNKILPLGDDVLLCPAHGAGSVCGSKIAERTWTTIGMERKSNPLCKAKSEQEFLELHGKMLDRPPYFLNMEELNLAGPPILGTLPVLKPLNPKAFEKEMTKAQLVDTRDQFGFGGGHIPGSLSMYLPILPSFAGWFLSYDEPILFVCDPDDTEVIVRTMIRMGFDQLSGYLGKGILGWAVSGNIAEHIPLVTVSDFCSMMKKGGDQFVLDVRDDDEFKGEGLKHATHIHLTHLLEEIDEIPKGHPVFPLCRSGNRAMLAASLLKREGWKDINLLMGGLSAWRAYGCNFDL